MVVEEDVVNVVNVVDVANVVVNVVDAVVVKAATEAVINNKPLRSKLQPSMSQRRSPSLLLSPWEILLSL